MHSETERRPPEGEAPHSESVAGGHHDDHNLDQSGEGGHDQDRYFDALFGQLESSFIEVRVIREGTGSGVVERRWYDSAEAVCADWASLLELAKREHAAIFAGVLPRRAKGVGKTEDVVAGWVVWVDLDYKDFPGGEAEARKRLSEFPVKTSMLVRSGHGLHGYWFLREAAEPALLSAISKRLARHLGGDHTFDAARLLRVPGSLNRKAPANPIPVEIESFDVDRAYSLSEIEESLDLVAPDPGYDEPAECSTPPPTEEAQEPRVRPAAPRPGPSMPGELPESVRDHIAKGGKIADYFIGKGKPEKGLDGTELDRSSSGYDFSLIVALVKAGVRDPGDLAAALWHRPDGKARGKGVDYIQRTIRGVLEKFAEKAEKPLLEQIDFKVESVRIFASQPATYEFVIEGKPLVLSSAQLRSLGAFGTMFLDVFHRNPVLPPKKNWGSLVNLWLDSAFVVEQPPEASPSLALLEEIERAVADLPIGEVVEDLDAGKALILGERRLFKASALLRRLRDGFPTLTSPVLCKALRDLGYDNAAERFEGQQVRAWCRDSEPPTYAREK